MGLNKLQLGKIRNCIRKHVIDMKNKRFWTYIRKFKLSTSHKTYCYIGSTDNKTLRQEHDKYSPYSDVINLTVADKFIKTNIDIITLNEPEYNLFFYDDDCVGKKNRHTIKTTQEQILLDECRLEAKTDSSIVILNKNNAVELIRQPSRTIWNNLPYICPCGYLTKGSDFTCINANKSQHCRQNYTHKQWVKNNPQQIILPIADTPTAL